MKSEINAIKSLIKSRNKGYKSESLQLKVTQEVACNNSTTWLTVTGFEASTLFAQMKPFLEPMICYVDIVTANEVRLRFNK
jgi:hypothetical protein